MSSRVDLRVGCCTEALRDLPDGSVDLIYADPPYGTGKRWAVNDRGLEGEERYSDRHEWTPELDRRVGLLLPSRVAEAVQSVRRLYGDTQRSAYIASLAAPLVEIRRLVSETGAVYLHVPVEHEHLIRVVADAALGRSRYRDSIAWRRSYSHHVQRRGWSPEHDSILHYAWPGHEYRIEGTRTPLQEREVAAYSRRDERGHYRTHILWSVPAGSLSRRTAYEWQGHTRCWLHARATLDRMLAEGRIILRGDEVPLAKTYLHEQDGVPISTLWTDIPVPVSTARERTGYPTQKPLSLLRRIIAASSPPDGLVCDPYLGSGTTAVAAVQLERRAVGCDRSPDAIAHARERLDSEVGLLAGS